MDIISRIEEIYLSENNDGLQEASFTTKVTSAYLFYHYFNADSSALTEIEESIINYFINDSFVIKSMVPSRTVDDGIDFLVVISEKDFSLLTVEDLCLKLKSIAKRIGGLVYCERSLVTQEELQAYDNLEYKVSDSTTFTIRALCCFPVDINYAIEVQGRVAGIEVKGGNVVFDILFQDNFEEEISDVESPKEYVANGSIKLFSETRCVFGDEQSFVTLISAKSLKQLFFQYATLGLFASNLRFYITNKKIDGKIVDTIKKEPEKFCYFNNGIIITCDDYTIKSGIVYLKSFSVVNGGQTTNLIGRTAFENDFGIICKIIKNKYELNDDRILFLSKVAEASNTQKPINARDLIANKIEQRKLKNQFAEAGMFLKIKRGEKIVKALYPEPYMNASNDEVTQMLYSYVFQSPGVAKNSKSQLLSNDRIYNLIFSSKYDSDFLISIQRIKIAYSEWQKHIKKNELHSSDKYGLSKHANYVTYALIGLILKVITNESIKVNILRLDDVSWKSDDLKALIRCNDIGTFGILKTNKYNEITKKTFFGIFDFLTTTILLPAYYLFKKQNPSYAYAQFCKTDSYYYDFVLPKAIQYCRKSQTEIYSQFSDFFNLEKNVNIKPDPEKTDMILLGMEEELKVYRAKIARLYGKNSDYTPIRANQIALILRYFPKRKTDLYPKADFSEDQVLKYGDDIINIVRKYIKTEDFE